MDELQEILHFARLNLGAYASTSKEAVKDANEVVPYEPEPRLVAGTKFCPAHIIYLDHDRKAVVLAVRGLDMASQYDFRTLCNNRKGKASYKGGYVHHGMLQAAEWLLTDESKYLTALLSDHPQYHLVLVGHSLGAGIATLATMLIADDSSRVGGIPRNRLKGYGIAPPRCVSLDLAIKYADVINGVILQDDFLPRMSTTTVAKIWPVADRTTCFCRYGVTCACCFVVPLCLKDTFVREEQRLKDPRRLYPAGRLYHVVVKEPLKCRFRHPPKVLTAVPVRGRFERVVITTSTFVDHNLTALIHALAEEMVVPPLSAPLVVPPTPLRMERVLALQQSRCEEEERAAGEMEKLAPVRRRVEEQIIAKDSQGGNRKAGGGEQSLDGAGSGAGGNQNELRSAELAVQGTEVASGDSADTGVVPESEASVRASVEAAAAGGAEAACQEGGVGRPSVVKSAGPEQPPQ